MISHGRDIVWKYDLFRLFLYQFQLLTIMKYQPAFRQRSSRIFALTSRDFHKYLFRYINVIWIETLPETLTSMHYFEKNVLDIL